MNLKKCLFAGCAMSLIGIGMMPAGCGGKVNVNQNIITNSGGGGTGGTPSTGGGGTGGMPSTGGGGTGGMPSTGGGGTGGTPSTGGGGTGGVGGTGGSPPTGADTCPGDPRALALGGTLILTGDTSTANADYSSFCGNTPPGSGNDVVYAITTTQPATVSYTLSAPGALDPVMYVRTTCDDANTTVWCRDFSNSTRVNQLHVDAGTHFLIVDGDAQTAGEFSLFVSALAPACGDGVVNPGEACDDGNTTSNDGCAGDCSTIEPGANDSCNDPADHFLVPSQQLVLSGSTLGNTHQHTYDHTDCTVAGQQPPPAIAVGGVSPDKVFRLVPTTNGTVSITLGFEADGMTPFCNNFASPGCWDRVLHVRHTQGATGPAACSGGENVSGPPSGWTLPSNQVACDWFGSGPNGYTQAVSFPVQIGESYYVFVGGYYDDPMDNYDQGQYNLFIDLTP